MTSLSTGVYDDAQIFASPGPKMWYAIVYEMKVSTCSFIILNSGIEESAK
jgi:hypothetical protein